MTPGPLTIFSRLTRLHTASMEGAAFPLAAFLGGAPVWVLPLIALLGILAHAGGNGMNSIVDLSYDRVDPSKKDHPLVRGDISPRVATAAVIACVLGAIAIIVGIASYRGTWLAIGFFAGYAVMGALYNLYTKKHKPLGVASFGLTFCLAFFAMAELWRYNLFPVVIAGAVYTAFYSAFMVGIAGEIKDIRQVGEPNLLRSLGATVGPDGWFSPGFWPILVAFGLMTGQVFSLEAMAHAVYASWWILVVGIVSIAVLLAYVLQVLAPGTTHEKALKVIGAGSAAGYILIVLAVAPALGPILAILFAVLPALFFAGMNRAIWPTSGSAWAPGV